MGMLVILLVLASLVGNSQGRECVNWFGAPSQRYIYDCNSQYDCCVSGASYAVKLNEEEVCPDIQGRCEFKFSDDPFPTVCPIVINGDEEMFGCGRGERCCHSLDNPPPEFNFTEPGYREVCSDYGVCENDLDYEDYFGEEMLEEEYEDHDYKDVACYSHCDFILDSPIDNETILEEYGWNICYEDQVEICDGGRKELCLFFEINTTVLITINSTHREEAPFSFLSSHCGKLDYDVEVDGYSPGYHCGQSIARFEDLARNMEWLFDQTIGWADCGQLEVCEEECVQEEHRPPKGGLAWWAILLIVIVVIICLAAIVLLYFMFCKRGSVLPSDDEAIMVLEAPEPVKEDPRVARMKQVEKYLDEAIKSRDMADLKLVIDICEHDGFQVDLKRKYDKAVQIFEDLMARKEEEKRKELEEAERKAEEAKRAMEEAEAELERRKEEEEEAALRKAQQARDEAKARWSKQWPRLQILRALNSVNQDVVAKAMEEARKAKEEEERLKKLEEEKARKAAHLKTLLKNAIASKNETKLEEAIKATVDTTFKTDIMDTDKELRNLHSKAQDELERLRKEREKKEKEEEEKRKEEERIKEQKRLAALAKLEEMKAALKRAISERDIAKLQKAIADVEENNLVQDVPDLHKQATELLERLQKIEKIKRNIQELKRPLIAELKSMSNPPADVHKAMIAAYILMGESLGKLKEWNNICILLNKTGKDSVKRRVQQLKVEDVSDEMASAAEDQMKGSTSDEVYEANQAASLFFDWAEMICFEKKHAGG